MIEPFNRKWGNYTNGRREELGWQARTIARARAGDEESAWLVVRAIMVELDLRYHDCALLQRLTDFVEALLDSKDAAGHRRPSRDQLGAALDMLGITRARGERKVQEAAWDELSAALGLLQADEAPVLRYAAAGLIEALQMVKNAAPAAAPQRKALVAALDVLNILPDPWRPPTGYRELLGRLAAEELEVRKGKSLRDARATLSAGAHQLGELRQGDIRRAHPELLDLLDGASRKELEGLADNLVPKKK